MTEEKKNSHEPEIEENQAEAVATSQKENEMEENEAEETLPDVSQLMAEVETLKKQLEEAESRSAEYKDNWLRSQAEFQNYRKRIDRDNELNYINMKGDIVRKILPVMDDLERALQNRSTDDPWANGIELIVRKFQNILESEGIKKIEALGAEFDPNFHEAISHEPADGAQSGQVIGVVQNGYMLGDRLIRPAMVRVAQ
jgi:molecular chaperone GrpE